jgi:uncharacterized protein YjiS (DUF1127 family)
MLNEAISFGEYSEYGEIARLIRLYRNWKARRRLAVLANCDERVLHTIGVTREQIRWAIALPLNINAVRALEEWSWKACENIAAGAHHNARTMLASDPKRAFSQQPAHSTKQSVTDELTSSARRPCSVLLWKRPGPVSECGTVDQAGELA